MSRTRHPCLVEMLMQYQFLKGTNGAQNHSLLGKFNYMQAHAPPRTPPDSAQQWASIIIETTSLGPKIEIHLRSLARIDLICIQTVPAH